MIKKQQQQVLNELHSEIVSLQRNKFKFKQLVNIAQGLKDIHQKKLVHRDFHSGNILKGIKQATCLITDLGLCKPANETSQEKLPYVAPEVLQGKPYTQASDIYSFGIIMHEILTGLPPYYNIPHDVSLALSICKDYDPNSKFKYPNY